MKIKRIGLSTSNNFKDVQKKIKLERLLRGLAHNFFESGRTILYSGDIYEYGSVIQLLMQEAMVLPDYKQAVFPKTYIENHIASIYKEKYEALGGKYKRVVALQSYSDTTWGNRREDTEREKYALQEVRCSLASLCNLRIAVGGDLTTAGVLYEIEHAIAIEKPILLLGEFGGVVGEFCIRKHRNSTDVKELARRVHLDSEEYYTLMTTTNVDCCQELIFKAIDRLDELDCEKD